MKKTRELTCIVCPRGCPLTVTFAEDGAIASITGYTCKRGYTYAQDECTAPRRTVTSTVRCEDGSVLSVKTAATVPKEKIFAVMREIDGVRAPDEVSIGDVLIADVCGTGVAVVATANKRKNRP